MATWLPWQHVLRFDRYPGDQLALLDPASHANPDPDAGLSITPSNYVALLDEVFDVCSGRDTLAPLAIAQDFLSSNEPVQTIRERGVRPCQMIASSRSLRRRSPTASAQWTGI